MNGPAANSSAQGATRLRHWPWSRIVPELSEAQLFLLLSIIIGLFSGLAVVLFRIAIEWTRFWMLGSSLAPGKLRVLLAPTLAGLGVALLTRYVFTRARGSGVNQTKAAVYIYDGYVPFQTVIGKFITCALAIGGGHSLGPEDPSLQMGAGLASLLGRKLRLSREKLRLIAPVGAAAGLAAAFNAPISAVIFVIEEVIGTWSAGVLGAIILAAVSSVVTMRWFLGSEPLFRIPAFRLAHPAELIAYAALGVIGGFASLGFLKFIEYARPRLRSLPRWTHLIQPAVAGLIIGIIAIWLPQVMGAGYAYVDQALHDQYPWRILALLGVFKIVATGISFTSDTPGGMFAPTLFIGAMIGGAVGGVEHHFFPHLPVSTAAFALVGMGTLFAGFLRVPITSVFMAIEITGNYAIVLPVMISNLLAYFISRRYAPMPLFDMLSKQEGVELPSMEEQRERTPLRVEQAMRVPDSMPLDAHESVGSALRRAEHSEEPFLLVSHPGGGWSGVSKEELHKQEAAGNGGLPVADVPPNNPLPFLFPDQPIDEALRLVGNWPVIPVVNRADFRHLEGVISLPDILRTLRQNPAT